MLTLSWFTDATIQSPEGGDIATMDYGELRLDMVDTDTYTCTTTYSSHAVEAGIAVMDSADPQPDIYTATVYLSERPASIGVSPGAIVQPVTLADGTSIARIVPTPGTTRKVDAHAVLRRLVREATLVYVEGAIREMEDWVISSVSAPRTADDAGALVCTIELVEWKVTTFADVDAPSPRVERGRRRSDQGTQTPETTDTPEATAPVSSSPEDNASALHRLGDFLGGVLER